MKIKKYLVIFLLLILANSIFAQDSVKDSGSQILHDLHGAMEKAGDSLSKTMKSMSSHACVGKWEFVNGNALTSIECLEDGTMSLMLKDRVQTTYYKGTYDSTMTEIIFHVTNHESKLLFSKKSELVNFDWIISYRVTGDKEMKLICSSFPRDGNGYDFKNPAIFLAAH